MSNFQRVLITGASSGLGEEFARQLANKADHLILVARRQPELEALRNELLFQHPSLQVTYHVCDLSFEVARLTLIDELSRTQQMPQLLINSAGLGDDGEFITSTWEKNKLQLRVNIEALTHLTQMFVPSMIENGGGAILQISSLASVMPIPDFAVYAATKAYVSSFSEALRIELAPHRIAVVAVCPGPVKTGFGAVAARNEEVRGGDSFRKSFYVSKEQVVKQSLLALKQGKARVYPGRHIAVMGCLLRLMPLPILRWFMSFRPRKQK